MAKGWITIEREITDHWIWKKEPFTKGQAWLDLLLHANHKPTRILIKGKVLKLDRGEQGRSEVTLANRWKWSRNKVRRFLNLLKTEQMIEQRTEQQTSVISICNYSKYQDKPKQDGTGNETGDRTGGGTGMGQGRDRWRNTEEQCKQLNNENNENNVSEDACSDGAADDPPPPDGEDLGSNPRIGKFLMTTDWRPFSDWWPGFGVNQGLRPEQCEGQKFEELLASFKGYWVDELKSNTERQWQTKLVDHINRKYQKTKILTQSAASSDERPKIPEHIYEKYASD